MSWLRSGVGGPAGWLAGGPAVPLPPVAKPARRRGPVGALPLSLREALHAHLAEPDDHLARLSGIEVHVSSLWGLCGRQRQLVRARVAGGLPLPVEALPVPLRMRFDTGKAVHDWVREHYLGPMGRLWGTWRCRSCQRKVSGLMPVEACHQCEAIPPDGWAYEEVAVRDAEWDLVGHLDGIEVDPQAGAGVLEIKSMESGRWRILREPEPAHVQQVQLYLQLADLPWGRLLYVSTGLEKITPFREFVLRRDPAVWAAARRQLTQVRAGKKVCATATDARALACPMAGPCWARGR